MELSSLTIEQASAGLRKKEFSSVEITEAVLKRIDSVDTNVHAYLSVLEEEAHIAAKMADEVLGRENTAGSLLGIPVALKDNMTMAGTITTSASRMLEHYRAPYDGTVVSCLKKEGAVIIGKTNLDEFAMGSSTENSAFGPTSNPWDLSCVPGGSSGGSAAAVSADECIYALGSDTGGSIRQPASLCGVVGLKPTYGQVSRYGLIAMASSLDQIGPITKTVKDAAIVFDAIKGADLRDASSARADRKSTLGTITGDIKGLKIGVPREYFIEGMDLEIEKATREAIEVYRSLGAEIIDVSLPHTEYALAVYYIIMPAEVSANLARFDGVRYGFRDEDAQDLTTLYQESRRKGFGAEVRRRIILGTYTLSSGYADAYYKKAQKVRARIEKDFAHAFTQVDCLLTPTTPALAFRKGEKSADPLTMYLEDIFTVSANIAGVPGISLPCGFASREGNNLPMGLQLMGKHWDEATILNAAFSYEQATLWHVRRPDILS